MIGLDTNVLVRYISQDDPNQAALATDFIEGNCSKESPGFVNHIVLCELFWVLKRCYGINQSRSLEIIGQIMRTVQLRVHEPQIVLKALRLAQKGSADFADYLISQINLSEGCNATVTLDRKAAKINSMKLLSSKSLKG